MSVAYSNMIENAAALSSLNVDVIFRMCPISVCLINGQHKSSNQLNVSNEIRNILKQSPDF